MKIKNQTGKGLVILLLIIEVGFINAFAQEFLWKAGIYNFFDNAEFDKSNVQIPQTMAGTHLAPEIGLKWNDTHRFFAGFDAMHEWGSDRTVDYFDPVVYYELAGKPFRFYAGAFPRKLALEKYPRMFFQDSINYYRPVMNGLFWEYGQDENYMNVWLDWASRQTYTRREAFFMGWSGRYNLNMFYVQHFGYMYHFAGLMAPEIPEALHDNGLLLTSLGIDLSSKTDFEKLEANAGWSVGLERDRDMGAWHRPQGLMSEIKVEYKGLALFNTFYKGQSQQVFRNGHGSHLYWGDPFYRTRAYNRADLSLWFYKSEVVNLKLTMSFHFTEQTMYHQQLFNASFDLDNFSRKGQKKYRYIWDHWIKQ